jgi:hypothetical protein
MSNPSSPAPETVQRSSQAVPSTECAPAGVGRLATLLLGALISLLLSSCTIIVTEKRFFWPHTSKPHVVAGDRRITREDLTVPAADSNIITGYALRYQGSRDFLIYFPGVGENANDDFERVRFLSESNHMSVVIFDYRGYGSSTGTPGFAHLLPDAETIYDYTLATYKPASVFAYGHSLGTVPAEDLGAKRNLNGVILEAGFTNARDAFRSISDRLPWPFNWLIHLKPEEAIAAAKPQPEELIAGLYCPLLVMHGTRDQSFPVSMAETLCRNAPSPKKRLLLVPGAKHVMNINQAPTAVEISHFIETYR